MKTEKYAPRETKQAIEESIAKRLNAAKHRNPPATFLALGLPTALIAEDITVTWAQGAYWVGTTTQEYAAKIGATFAEANETLSAKSL